MVWKETKQTEIELKNKIPLDLSLFRKKSNARTFRGLLLQKMKDARKDENPELCEVLQFLYKEYIKFEELAKINLYGWQGKSTFEVFTKPDGYLIVTYQRPDKDSPYKPIETYVTKKEVNLMWVAINNLKEKYENGIPTKEIAREYCCLGNLTDGTHKKSYFINGVYDFDIFISDRATYIPFNKILNLLDYWDLIKYRGGITKMTGKSFGDLKK